MIMVIAIVFAMILAAVCFLGGIFMIVVSIKDRDFIFFLLGVMVAAVCAVTVVVTYNELDKCLIEIAEGQ